MGISACLESLRYNFFSGSEIFLMIEKKPSEEQCYGNDDDDNDEVVFQGYILHWDSR